LGLASVRPPHPNPRRNPLRPGGPGTATVVDGVTGSWPPPEPSRRDIGFMLLVLDDWLSEHPMPELST